MKKPFKARFQIEGENKLHVFCNDIISMGKTPHSIVYWEGNGDGVGILFVGMGF